MAGNMVNIIQEALIMNTNGRADDRINGELQGVSAQMKRRG